MTTLFEDVDRYIETLFVAKDPVLQQVLDTSEAEGLAPIHVSAAQGKLLYILAKLTGAARILEIGTLGGYSTIWLGRALPDHGEIISLEVDERHANIARRNLDAAGLAGRASVHLGDALGSLHTLAQADTRPFDLVFIDADKQRLVDYLEAVLPLMRPGGLLIADNVIRGGKVLDPSADDASSLGVSRFNEKLAVDGRLETILLQQVGQKGHDGLAIARLL